MHVKECSRARPPAWGANAPGLECAPESKHTRHSTEGVADLAGCHDHLLSEFTPTTSSPTIPGAARQQGHCRNPGTVPHCPLGTCPLGGDRTCLPGWVLPITSPWTHKHHVIGQWLLCSYRRQAGMNFGIPSAAPTSKSEALHHLWATCDIGHMIGGLQLLLSWGLGWGWAAQHSKPPILGLGNALSLFQTAKVGHQPDLR